MDDVFNVARSHYNRNVIESLFTSPGCHWRGDQFVTLSPLEFVDTIGGFEISEKGIWYDFRSDEGGDLIDLVSQSQYVPKLEAAKIIIKTGDGVIPEKIEQKKNELPKYKKFDYDSIEFKKSLKSYVSQDWQRKTNGEAKAIYIYKDGKGKGIFCTVRFIKDGKKTIRPIYMDSAGRFYNKAPQGLDHYLPYGIENLKDNDFPVIIVEGEKCANIDVKKYVLLSAYNTKKTDWSCIKNRDVFIWPDLDCEKDDFGNYKSIIKQPGYIKAMTLKSCITHANIIDVYGKIELGEKKHGWDIVDSIEEGKDVSEFIKSIGIVGAVDVDIIPYQVYLKFIEMEYNRNGLEQINGIFWHYDDIDHYWKKVMRQDLDVNFQSWIFKTKIIDLLHTIKGSKPTTFINDSITYLHRHTSNRYRDNPFKDSAISPYIHHKDGVIEIGHESIKFISRASKDENYFKKLYPIFCFNYGLSEKKFDNFDLERDCPAFNYFIEGIVPRTIKGDLRKEEIETTKNYISQVFAYALSPLKHDAYIFNITGNQHTGKTFFTDIIKEFIGHDFVMERSIEAMESRFATYDLWGTKVYIESDVPADKTIPDDFIKKYAGEVLGVTVEQKHEATVKGIKLSIAMFFVSNYQIKFGNKIEGIERRLCPIPFKNRLLKKDKLLLNKILGRSMKGEESGKYKGKTFNELSGILAFALHGWQQFAENNYTFTFPRWVAHEKENWKMDANTIIKYMSETYKIADRVDRINSLDLYNNYKEWCVDEDHKPFGRNNFYKEIRRMDYVREIDTIKPHVFVINGIEDYADEDAPF